MPASAASSSIEASGPMRWIARSAASSSSARRSSRDRRGPRGRPTRPPAAPSPVAWPAGSPGAARSTEWVPSALVTGTKLARGTGGAEGAQQLDELVPVRLEPGGTDAGAQRQGLEVGRMALGDARQVAVVEHHVGRDAVGLAALAAPGPERLDDRLVGLGAVPVGAVAAAGSVPPAVGPAGGGGGQSL